MTTFAVLSLGCKVNDYEATYVKEELKKEYELVSPHEFADIYIVFSCCVTDTAESKTRKAINKLKRLNPNAFICVAGCYAQTKSDAPIFNHVDLLIGSKYKNKIPELIKEKRRERMIESNRNLEFESMFISNYPNKSRAFLKIQDGCNQFCSYCIIPYARGNERSESHTKLLKIAKDLSKNYKEIVLTGIHTGRYNDNGYNLYNLLCDLIKIKNLKIIRISSIELNEVTDEIIDLMSNNPKIAPHLHIPVQALNDHILMTMHRTYTLEEFKERIKYIRSKIKDISISTDLIVGFPGETNKIFKTYFKELDDIKFSFIHVFPYSKKNRTLAAGLKNQIDPNIKKQRVNQILQYEKDITYEYQNRFINTIMEVLVEETDNTYSYGYTKNYMFVKLEGLRKVGEICKVIIKDIKDNIILGEYVS